MTGPPKMGLAVPPAASGRALALVLVTAALLGAGLWAVRWTTAAAHASGDTFWYTRQALMFAGRSEPDATATAADFIVSLGRGNDPTAWIEAARTIDRRYVSIFESRPVYPLAAAPLVGPLGTDAMAASTLAAAIVFSMAVAGLVWPAAGSIAALAAVAVAFALPSGAWLTFLNADGWMFATLAAALAAAAAYLRTDRRGWLVAFVACLCLLYATKSANGAVLVVAAVALAVLSAARTRSLRTPMVALGAAAAVTGAALMIAFAALRVPGLNETLQDLLTVHFAQPDVASPWLLLVRRVAGLAPKALVELAGQPRVVTVAAVGLGTLVAVRAWWAGLVALAGVSAALTVIVHPVVSEIPRLMAPIWISVAVGWGLLAAAAVRWLRTRFGTASTAPVAV